VSWDTNQNNINTLLADLEDSFLDFEQHFPYKEFKEARYKQTPLISLLTCSDARVPVTLAGKLFNRVFAVENIGNQVRTSEGSILYGLLHLHTPIMLIAGHSDCGAIKATLSDYSEEPSALQCELNTVKKSIREGIVYLESVDKLNLMQLAEINVDVQIEYLIKNPEVKKLVDNQRLLIIGLILDLHNIYKHGRGLIYISNINGNRSSIQIMNILDKKGPLQRFLRTI